MQATSGCRSGTSRQGRLTRPGTRHSLQALPRRQYGVRRPSKTSFPRPESSVCSHVTMPDWPQRSGDPSSSIGGKGGARGESELGGLVAPDASHDMNGAELGRNTQLVLGETALGCSSFPPIRKIRGRRHPPPHRQRDPDQTQPQIGKRSHRTAAGHRHGRPGALICPLCPTRRHEASFVISSYAAGGRLHPARAKSVVTVHDSWHRYPPCDGGDQLTTGFECPRSTRVAKY